LFASEKVSRLGNAEGRLETLSQIMNISAWINQKAKKSRKGHRVSLEKRRNIRVMLRAF
jgi:hypothetical protein